MNDSMTEQTLNGKVILVTGAARRIGAAIVTRLHENGARVAIHYRGSADDAENLTDRLNMERANSAAVFQADLLQVDSMESLVDAVVEWGGQLDGLVNNASSFYATPVGSITETQWDELIGSNLKAPLFLSQAAADQLRDNNGAIINIIDIHAERPLRDHARLPDKHHTDQKSSDTKRDTIRCPSLRHIPHAPCQTPMHRGLDSPKIDCRERTHDSGHNVTRSH